MRLFKIILFILFISQGDAFSNTYTVTNTGDSGAGSLRAAITSANTHPGSTVAFNIPTSDGGYNITTGTWTISILSDYPYITASGTVIDGTTQTTNVGNYNLNGPEIVLDGVTYTIDYGLFISASNCVIKGLTIMRCIDGIQIYGAAAKNNTISGNYIGTNFDATDTSGNNIGIEIIGGPKFNTVGGITANARNIVSGNRHIGIRLVNSDSNYVYGNFVGINRTGTSALMNYDGVSIEGTAQANTVGGTVPAKRNIVSGNDAYGVPIIGTSAKFNKIMGNYIGTDTTGTSAIPNTYGVLFDDGSSYNIVGGDSASCRNIISGNSAYGVFVYNLGTNHNLVRGNYIGTDKTGTLPVPNANGVVIDGAAIQNTIDNNVISGNSQQGIDVHISGSDSNIITRNYIGTDYTGTLPLANTFDGIRIAEGVEYTLIGGSAINANIIAYNGGNGVTIMTSADLYNKISCNSIYKNDSLGIDLFPPGVNINDLGGTDSIGPNELMNYPVITSVQYWTFNSQTVIQGYLDTRKPQNATIEIFLADSDSTMYGQGKTYLGNTMPDASGNWSFHVMGVNPGDVITTTATDDKGNTSEFSFNKAVDINTGIINIEDVSSFIIYPNPSNGNITLKLGNDSKWEQIDIIDVTGRVVYFESILATNLVFINLSSLADRMYFVEMTNITGSCIKPFSIIK